MDDNLSRVLSQIAWGIDEQVGALTDDGEGAIVAATSALRDHACQMRAVAGAIGEDGAVAWSRIDDEIGVDLQIDPDPRVGRCNPGPTRPMELPMTIQEKFRRAMQRLATERDLDLVVEPESPETGWYSFQPHDTFEPVLRFPYSFRSGCSTFSRGGRPGPLGRDRAGVMWGTVEGGGHDRVIARVRTLLDGEPADGPLAPASPDAGGLRSGREG